MKENKEQNGTFIIDIRPKKANTLEECTTIVDVLKYYGAIQETKNNIAFNGGFIRFKESNVFELDILTIVPEERGKGYAKNIMKLLIHASDVINKPITLVTGNVIKRPESLQLGIDYAGHYGSMVKNKIPIMKLPDFYKKFGFKITNKEGKNTWMAYIPENYK